MQIEPTDNELLTRLKKGDEKAMEILFRRYYAYLCRTIHRLLPNSNRSEDLAQEVFFEVWKKRNRLQINSSPKAYLRRAAVNKTLNYIRDNKTMLNTEEGSIHQIAELTATPIQKLEAEEMQKVIDDAIDSLPERCRQTFVLSRFENMSYQEIANTLSISPKTVENQISKALRLLRKALKQYLPLGIWGAFVTLFTNAL